jgi:hypothetical protein
VALRAEAHAWWDEVEDVRRRERVARRQLAATQAGSRARRRPPRRPAEHVGPRPDRIAAWAVAMGLLLVVLAALSAHG